MIFAYPCLILLISVHLFLGSLFACNNAWRVRLPILGPHWTLQKWDPHYYCGGGSCHMLGINSFS